MASARTTREGERRLSLGTLAIASLASATAAVVVSTFWRSGTPIAAAVTPVIVALVSEMLHRPTAVIAERLTNEADALPLSQRISKLGGREPEPTSVRSAERPRPRPDQPPRVPREDAPPRVPGERGTRPIPTDGHDEMRVYPGARRTAPRRPPPGLPWKAILVTAVLAFAIGATVLTVPELLAGNSLGGSNKTTVFGGSKKQSTTDQDSQSQDRQNTTTQPQQTTPQQTQQQTTPQQKAPQTNQQQRRSGQATTPTTPTTPKKSP